jgi:hypothetical protein
VEFVVIAVYSLVLSLPKLVSFLVEHVVHRQRHLAEAEKRRVAYLKEKETKAFLTRIIAVIKMNAIVHRVQSRGDSAANSTMRVTIFV